MGTVQPIPCLLSMPTRNHMDITTPPLPPVAPEVLRVAEHRHKKGLMYPYIFHILTKVLPRLLEAALSILTALRLWFPFANLFSFFLFSFLVFIKYFQFLNIKQKIKIYIYKCNLKASYEILLSFSI